MTIEEFREKLKNHDWLYVMSEDSGVYWSGSMERNELLREAALNKEFMKEFNKYKEDEYIRAGLTTRT